MGIREDIDARFSDFSSIIVIIIFIILAILIIYILFSKSDIIKFFFDFFVNIFGTLLDLSKSAPVINNNSCSVTSDNNVLTPRLPSLFTAHLAFFFGFILTNAYYLYNKNTDNNEDSNLVKNRINRTRSSIVILCILYICIVITRLNITECESLLGILFTTSIFASLGYGWYRLAKYCGVTLYDIYGITSSILPTSSKNKAPVVCIKT